jgi:hypothetical protein
VKARDSWHRWAKLDAAALFVVFDEARLVRRTMLAGIDVDSLPFPVLVDRERDTYRRWGLARASWRTVFLDPKVYATYWRLLRAGERLRAGGADLLQLGGDFVIGPAGLVAYARPQERDDRPPIGTLLEAARTASGAPRSA